MSSCHREPRLKDLLADSVVKAVMEADGVDTCKLEAELQETAAVLLATGRSPKSPDATLGDLALGANGVFENPKRAT